MPHYNLGRCSALKSGTFETVAGQLLGSWPKYTWQDICLVFLWHGGGTCPRYATIYLAPDTPVYWTHTFSLS